MKANQKAQLHFEAMLAFLCLTAALALAVSAIEKQKQESALKNSVFSAESAAQQCAVIADALFSNTESSLKKTSLNCTAGKEYGITSAGKTASCIARQVKTTRINGRNVLEVKTSAHYG
ncbi:MAG: hypothetical protein PHH08_02750 [Candidatus ainarchaeum sp.]|nr:hypothetical protein [Candidatus ainarchaeum sp.]